MEHAEKSGVTDGGGSERRRGRRWVAVGLAVVVVVLVFFALEQAGGGGSGPLDAIAKAAESTQREVGGHALIHVTVTASDTPEGITESGSIVFENGGRARGTLVIRGLTTGRRAKIQVIADGTTSYASSGQVPLPEGRKWAKVDFSSADSSSSLPADGGPREGLKLLEQMDGAEEIGKEDIRRVATTRYRGTLPVSENEVFGVEVQVAPPQVEVWIDARSRVRRMTIIITGSVGGKEGSATTDMTMDFFDFGPVSKIELPKQDEIYDATGRVESNFQASAEAP